MTPEISNAELRELKAQAQHLDPLVRLGSEGASEAFYAALEEALTAKELVKVKFSSFKEDKKTLAPEIAERTGSKLVQRVGNTATFFRPKPEGEEDEGEA